MKPKNVMLLGFINRAVNYIDQHMDDEPNTRLTELKNIDLIALRDELSSNLDITLGTMQSTMSTLLKAGNEAFDDFISSNPNYYGSDSLSRSFDERLDDSFASPKSKKSLKQLAKLLSYYNLEDEMGGGVNTSRPARPEQMYQQQMGQQQYQQQMYQQQMPQQQYQQQMPEQVADDDEIMNQIRDNATKNNAQTNEKPQPKKNKENDEAIDSIFTEIIDNEPEHNATIDSLINDLRKSMQKEDDLVRKNKEVKQISRQEQAKQSIPSGISAPTSKSHSEPVIGEQGYVNDLFGDLKKQLAKEESDKQKDEIKKKEAYNRIGKLYTYLPKSFIRNVYALKESLSQDYPLDEKIIILHRISFHEVENLRQFVEIGISHGYTINADEEKMIVDIFKEHTNTDGKILTNIYEIANQGYILNGVYEGYNVLVEDE